MMLYRHRDSRNKELFEKMFPELRSKRDQLRDEAYSRYGHCTMYLILVLVLTCVKN